MANKTSLISFNLTIEFINCLAHTHSKPGELQLSALSCLSVHVYQLNIKMYGGTADRMVLEEVLKWSNGLRCRELRLGRTRFSITYMDSETCIMRTNTCNKEENWKKIGLLAYDCEGKKEMAKKKQENS